MAHMEAVRGDIPLPHTRQAHGSVSGVLRALAPCPVGWSIYVEGPEKTVTNTAGRVLGRGNWSYRREGAGWRVWRKA